MFTKLNRDAIVRNGDGSGLLFFGHVTCCQPTGYGSVWHSMTFPGSFGTHFAVVTGKRNAVSVILGKMADE